RCSYRQRRWRARRCRRRAAVSDNRVARSSQKGRTGGSKHHRPDDGEPLARRTQCGRPADIAPSRLTQNDGGGRTGRTESTSTRVAVAAQKRTKAKRRFHRSMGEECGQDRNMSRFKYNVASLSQRVSCLLCNRAQWQNATPLSLIGFRDRRASRRILWDCRAANAPRPRPSGARSTAEHWARGKQIATKAAPICYMEEMLDVDAGRERAIRWLIALMVL